MRCDQASLPTLGKMRKMVVAETQQGRNLGLQLIVGVENALITWGTSSIELSSPMLCTRFFQWLDYTTAGGHH